jgi:hypothetical protein
MDSIFAINSLATFGTLPPRAMDSLRLKMNMADNAKPA